MNDCSNASGWTWCRRPTAHAHARHRRSPARSSTRCRMASHRPSSCTAHRPDLQVAGDVGERRPDDGADADEHQHRDDKASDHGISFSAMSSSTKRAASSTAAATGGDRPMPSPTSAGSHPTSSSRPISPPSSATLRAPPAGPSGGCRAEGRRRGRPRARAGRRCPAPLLATARRRARPGRSPRAARRRGGRLGCRSPRPARRRASVARARRWATSLPNPSSPLKMLPMPATRVFVPVIGPAPPRRDGSTGSGRATGEARPPGRRRGSPPGADSPSTSENTPSTVADAAGQEQVLSVGATAPRAAASPSSPCSPPRRRCGWCRSTGRRRRRPPAPTTAAAPRAPDAATGWRRAAARRSPASKSSTRSTMAAARGSVARASTFSSSVRVSTRSARISSISVESHMSPGLSSATSGTVVQDDRRRQHRRVVAFVADQHGERVVVRARRDRATSELRRIERRQERAVVGMEQDVNTDQRPPHRRPPVGRLGTPSGEVLDPHLQAGERVRPRHILDDDPDDTVDRPSLPHHATLVAERLDLPKRRNRERRVDGADDGELDARHVDRLLDRLLPRRPPATVDVELRHRHE